MIVKNNSISRKNIKYILKNKNIILFLKKYIKIEKKRGNLFAICPFHSEKTPSFFICEKKQRYFCFGCKKTGNIIDFLMEYKNLNFEDALEILLKEKINKNYNKKNIVYFYINKKIEKIYQLNLYKLENTKVLKYIKNDRKLDENIINGFKIGYSGKYFNYLTKKISNFKKIKKVLLKLGIIKLKYNNIYDTFYNRIIFPIKNEKNETLGFAGRTIEKNKLPKYLNSNDSTIFSKKNELYGNYDQIKLKNEIIIVEGYFDVIKLNKFNIKNVLSIMGSSFTKYQFKKLLKKYNRIIFCFDGDKAGRIASIRAAYICLNFMNIDKIIKFILIPKNYDPDSYIEKFGNYKFKILIKNSIYIFDYILYYIKTNLNFKNKFENIFFLKKIDDFLSKIKNLEVKKEIKKILFKKKDKNIKKDLDHILKLTFMILNDRNLFKNIKIHKIILNKNFKFNSKYIIFIEVLILLSRNNNTDYLFLKEKLINKFIIKKIKKTNIVKNNYFDFLIIMDSLYNF